MTNLKRTRTLRPRSLKQQKESASSSRKINTKVYVRKGIEIVLYITTAILDYISYDFVKTSVSSSLDQSVRNKLQIYSIVNLVLGGLRNFLGTGSYWEYETLVAHGVILVTLNNERFKSLDLKTIYGFILTTDAGVCVIGAVTKLFNIPIYVIYTIIAILSGLIIYNVVSEKI